MQFDNGIPIYVQIIREMTLRILSKKMQPGDKLPSVRELAADFGVNPNTMQRAMTEMEREGLVFTERTNGRFITADEGLLVKKRKEIAREGTQNYIAYMEKIGFTKEEIVSYILETEKKEEVEV